MKKLKIAFANLNNTLYADGSRILSARLKEMGHDVRLIFLIERDREYFTDNLLDQFVQHVADVDLVLLSFLSDDYTSAIQLTRFIKERVSGPVVWGGIHATVAPEPCMEHVDILCIGEGDEALPELVGLYAEGKPYHQVKNFWFRKDDEVIRNEMRPLFHDLDSNPWPDYELQGHFVRDDDDVIKPMTEELLAKYHNTVPLGFHHYPVTSTRGCAQFCSYCYNATFKEMFKGQCRIRFRSLDDVVEEIRSVLERYAFFRSFAFSDDDFFLRPKKQLEHLAELIRGNLSEVISRSFWACAATPFSITEEKLDLLVPAGLRAINIGVQTGSERMNRDVYHRRFKNALFYEKAEILDRRFHKELIILLDFMINCPYETDEDHVRSVEMFLEMPKWLMVNMYRFTFYPGSPIYERAVEDNIIDRSPQVFSAKNFWPFFDKGYSFMIHVLVLVGCSNYILPDWIKKLLIHRWVRAFSRLIPQKLLDMIPWDSLYRKLWDKNMRAIYKGRELRHR